MADKVIPDLNLASDNQIKHDVFFVMDTGAETLKVSYAQLFDAFNGGGGDRRTVSNATTISNDDTIIEYNTTSGAISQTLPANNTIRVGKVLILKNIGIAGNDLTLTGSIDNQSSIVLAGNADFNDTIKLLNTGSKYEII